ncbi:MAG: hypothetical protein KBC46_08060 [Ferrovibrio sp.]|nr:hypothetical protein [Ferrovibrio sp.]
MSDMDAVRQGMREIDFVLYSSWRLGKHILAGWSHENNQISFAFSAPYNVLGNAEAYPRLIRGRRLMGGKTFAETCKVLGIRPLTMDVPFSVGQGRNDVNPAMIENLVKRYAVVETANRAVMLFDIVGFSKHSPLEQVAQLSSLEYSINSASKRLNEVGLRNELARSTVGDGFYVWNRAKGVEADMRTYIALILILADNALARRKGNPRLVPILRAAFTVGPHFSYHQVEGNNPRGFEYIVGDVTIGLARIIGKAQAQQVLIGQFNRSSDQLVNQSEIDTILFLARAEKLVQPLIGQELGGYRITNIRASVTSAVEVRNGVTVYRIMDKHGFSHQAFNARITIDRDGAESISLGLGTTELGEFGAEPTLYDVRQLSGQK